MRYAEGHAEASRAHIVAAASKALRQSGLSGLSVPALMKKAGLTHGGFYGHFSSRDELVAEAVMLGAEETAASVLTSGAPGLEEMLGKYLSLQHVKHPEAGCVLAALGTEGRVQSSKVRKTFSKVARGFLELVELRRKKPKPAELSDETLVVASRMIGAVMLARLVEDDALAERILAAARVVEPATQRKGLS